MTGSGGTPPARRRSRTRSRLLLPEMLAFNVVAWFGFVLARGLPDRFSRKAAQADCLHNSPFLEGAYDTAWGWTPPGYRCLYYAGGPIEYGEPTWSSLAGYGLTMAVMATSACVVSAVLIRYGYPHRGGGLFATSVASVLLPLIAALSLAVALSLVW